MVRGIQGSWMSLPNQGLSVSQGAPRPPTLSREPEPSVPEELGRGPRTRLGSVPGDQF